MKINYCGKDAQERMIRNGWRLQLKQSYNESPEAMYERLSKRYKTVKIYWVGTMIKGIHEYFAFCKN
jgi:hypothetical protein